jgi:hypothetical protein
MGAVGCAAPREGPVHCPRIRETGRCRGGRVVNERVRAAILSTHVDPFFEAKRTVLSAKLQEILRPFKESYAMALDVDFLDATRDMANKTIRPTSTPSTNVFGTEFLVDAVQNFQEAREAPS